MIKRFLGSAAWILSANVGGKMLGFGLLAALTFFIAPNELGVYGAIFTAISSIYTMSGWGVPVVIQRVCAKRAGEDIGKIIVAGISILFLGIILSLFLLRTQQPFFEQHVFKKDIVEHLPFLPWLIIAYFFARLPLTIFLGFGEFKLFALRNLLERGLLLICVLTGVIANGLQGAITGLLVGYVIAAIFTMGIFRSVLSRNNVRLVFNNVRRNILKILKEGVPYFLGNTFPSAAMNFVVIAVFTTYISYEDYGFFRAGQGIVGIMAVVPAAMRPVTITYIAKFKDKADKIKSVQLRILTMGIVSISILLLIFIDEFVGIAFGGDYSAGIYLFKGLLLVNIIRFVARLANSLIVGSGHLVYSGIVGLSYAVLYGVLLFALVPRMGINGFLIAFGASHCFTLVAVLVKEFIEYKHEDALKYITLAVLSLVLVSAILFVDGSGFDAFQIRVFQMGLFVLYVVGGFVFVLTDNERRYAKSVLAKLKVRWA